MKVLKIIFAFGLVLLCNADIKAQSNDVLILKDGSILKGTISEYIPDSTLTIVLMDGRTKTLKASEISKLEEAKNRVFNQKKIGYFNNTSMGFMLGHGTYGVSGNFQFNLVNGVKVNNMFYGIGTGMETFEGAIFTPFFAEVSHQLSDKKVSPIFSAQAGITRNFAYEDDLNYFHYNNFKSGGVAGLNFGIRTQMNEQLAFTISAGYRYYNLSGKYNDRFWDQNGGWIDREVTSKADIHRFNFKLGLLFL